MKACAILVIVVMITRIVVMIEVILVVRVGIAVFLLATRWRARLGIPPRRRLARSSYRFIMCNTLSVALRILTRCVMLGVISLPALQHGERDRHPGRLSPELPPAALRALLSLFCIGPGFCPIHPTN
jgi:hypothetical protein